MKFLPSLLGLVAFAAAPAAQLPPAPPGNPTTAEKAMLGKALFWDEQLSSTRTVACGTCHLPVAGGQDPRPILDPPASTHPGPDGLFGTEDDILGSRGVPRSDGSHSYLFDAAFGMEPAVTRRKAPTVINAAFGGQLFWDGRASGEFRDPVTDELVLPFGAAVENVVAEPFVNPVEMGDDDRTWPDVLDRIDASPPLALSPDVPVALESWIAGRPYAELFEEAFGSPGITAARTCMAVAAYLRTLVSDRAPIDAFLAGDSDALTPFEQLGLSVFGSCQSCHVVHPEFAGQTLFFYNGVRPKAEDPGRFAVTGVPSDLGRMKAPDLRNIELRAPYFHGGNAASLDEVIDLYAAGGHFDVGSNDLLPNDTLNDPEVRAALLAFLGRPLTDPRVANGLPPFDHPALSEGTDRRPQPFGAGTPNALGVAPVLHAIEPPFLPTPDYGIAISGSAAGSVAALAIDAMKNESGSPFEGAVAHLGLGGSTLVLLEPLSGSGPTGGWASFLMSVPASPALDGASVYAQGFALDPHPDGLLTSTGAFELRLFD